jgi:hypothetical protein
MTKLIVTESSGASSVIKEKETTIVISPFDAGLRQMLEASESNSEILTENKTLTDSDNVIQMLDPNGSARTVTLPEGATTNHGFVIYNYGEGAEIITVKNYAGTTLGTVYPNNAGWYLSSNLIYRGAGGGSQLINELSDVDITSAADEEILQYNGTTSKWENVSAFSMPRQANYSWREAVTDVTINTTVTGAALVVGGWRNTAANAADGDEYYFYPLLEKGTYEILTLGVKMSWNGISDLYVNGTEEGSYDWYATSQMNNIEFLVTGITILTSGRQEIKYKMDGKNSYSSNYGMAILQVIIRRTGD